MIAPRLAGDRQLNAQKCDDTHLLAVDEKPQGKCQRRIDVVGPDRFELSTYGLRVRTKEYLPSLIFVGILNENQQRTSYFRDIGR